MAPVPDIPVPDVSAPAMPSMPEPTTTMAMPAAPVVPTQPAASDTSDVVVQPDMATDTAETPAPAETKDVAVVMAEVADKIADSHNILIALSGDPSVDEMASAIGLATFLDRLGKRATVIYSGKTPDAIQFLEPDAIFEPDPDTLQDFVIALNKEKADHLRYKLDGDFVRIYITPYKTKITAEDLEFSYGDYNVDLVLALNVPNGTDLDSALREHGRIMHDATIINITAAKPGKFGEIEWSNTHASSVSEMLAELLMGVGGKVTVEPKEATAFLTGIVAATDRFSKPNTTPETMQTASRLMELGANQQLITENITDGLDNKFFSFSVGEGGARSGEGEEAFDVEHEGKKKSDSSEVGISEVKTAEVGKAEEKKIEPKKDEFALPALDEPASAGEEKPESSDAEAGDGMLDELKAAENDLKDAAPDYGKMLEDALAEPDTAELPEAPEAPVMPEIPAAPEVKAPEGNVLPPPPAPPIDLNMPMPEAPVEAPAEGATGATTEGVAAETSVEAATGAPSNSAFQIPTLPE